MKFIFVATTGDAVGGSCECTVSVTSYGTVLSSAPQSSQRNSINSCIQYNRSGRVTSRLLDLFIMTNSKLSILALPAEVTDQILSYLSPLELVDTLLTCRLLYTHASKDQLWQAFVQQNMAFPLPTPSPSKSFRELFISHHPHWFLTRHKIWFGDPPMYGKLLFARYDSRHGCIEAYAVVAERGPFQTGFLDWNVHSGGQIEYNTFNPKVQLDLNRPVLRLSLDDLSSSPRHGVRLQSEIAMDLHSGNTNRIASTFFLTRPLPQHLHDDNTSLWPPLLIPTPESQRTRNTSDSSFYSLAHKPCKLSQVSDGTFRIRQWMEFSNYIPQILGSAMRRAETISTFGTLTRECYTPTKEKPWQGIWCGDYAGHGCEFLVIMQPDHPKPLPPKAREAFRKWPYQPTGLFMGGLDVDDMDLDPNAGGLYSASVAPTSASAARHFLERQECNAQESIKEDSPPYRGKLEAIKLTGDPNVPRGEITFVVDELGSKGLVGYAHEPIFNDQVEDAAVPVDEQGSRVPQSASSGTTFTGARMVKSVGHIADHGFTRDAYIPSQLILISERRLAQYWQSFGLVSFYQRVDLEALMNC